MNTEHSLLVKKPTAIDVKAEERRSALGAHIALIVVSLCVALPSPVAGLWGGNRNGSPWLAFGLAAFWAILSLYLKSQGRIETTKKRGLTSTSTLLLMVDVFGLTAMLSVSGAAQNPFTMLYFVPITQATLIARSWTFRVAALSVAGFSILLAQTAYALRPHLTHAHQSHFFDHVQGMAIALAVAGIFITLFVQRVAQALEKEKEAVRILSHEQQQDRTAVALGALSAGAAHELGTPLGTIQVLSEELPHLSGEERTLATQNIINAVQRMKKIIHQMNSSELSAFALQGRAPWSLGEIEKDLRATATDEALKIKVDAPYHTTQPKEILLQILKELVRNALFGASAHQVRIQLTSTKETLHVVVTDEGPGMDEETLRRASEPFVSTTGSTGLGLFLASVHAKQLGGFLQLESKLGKGTQASLQLPLHAPQLSVAKPEEHQV